MSFTMAFTSSEMRILRSLCKRGGEANLSRLKQSIRMDKLEKKKAIDKLTHDKVVEIVENFNGGRPSITIHLLKQSVQKLFK